MFMKIHAKNERKLDYVVLHIYQSKMEKKNIILCSYNFISVVLPSNSLFLELHGIAVCIYCKLTGIEIILSWKFNP